MRLMEINQILVGYFRYFNLPDFRSYVPNLRHNTCSGALFNSQTNQPRGLLLVENARCLWWSARRRQVNEVQSWPRFASLQRKLLARRVMIRALEQLVGRERNSASLGDNLPNKCRWKCRWRPRQLDVRSLAATVSM